MAAGESRGEEVFTRDEMEVIFARRKSEQRALLEDAKAAVVGALQPQLEGMRRDIQDSNHLKAEFGQQLHDLAEEVRATNKRVDEHIIQPAHKRGLGMAIETMSEEELEIFPYVMRAAVADRNQVSTTEKSSGRRMNVQLVIATAVGSLASLLFFGLALLVFLLTRGRAIA